MILHDYKLKIGDPAPGFTLTGSDEREYSLDDFSSTRLLVVFFTCNHCPYAQAYETRIEELVDEMEPDVVFVGINSNDANNYPEDSFEKMKERGELAYTYLRDESQDIARAYGAECTPHFFLFDEERRLRYQGRFDDNWQSQKDVTRKELQDAILALLDGNSPRPETTRTMGCSIKWKN